MTDLEREILEFNHQLAIKFLSHHFLMHALLHSLDAKTLQSVTVLLESQRSNYEFDELTSEALDLALAAVHGIQDDDKPPQPPSLHLIHGSKK